VKDGLENKKNLSCWIDYENAAFLAQAGLFHVRLFLSIYTHVNLYMCIYDTVMEIEVYIYDMEAEIYMHDVEIEVCIYDMETEIYIGIDIDMYIDIPYMYIVYVYIRHSLLGPRRPFSICVSFPLYTCI